MKPDRAQSGEESDTMSADYLDQLAEFVATTRAEDLPHTTISAAKDVVLDTVGAIASGSRLPENANLARLTAAMGGPGKSSAIGHSQRVPAMWATMVNGTAGVAQEMDEGTRLGGGHPSIHVTPASLAVAEESGSSGADTLAAIVAAYEVTSRIGTATNVRSEVHSHGTWGTIGAAAATARLLGYGAGDIRLAMNLAASMSPANTWTPCLEGATVRNLYPGRSGFQGILAAHLARCGFTAVEDGPSDIYGSILGKGFDAESAVVGLSREGPMRIQQNYFKFHACCLYNHPVLDAVQHAMAEHSFRADQVETVEAVTPPIVRIMADPEPNNMLAAKFSIPYAVASLIAHGNTGVTAFYPEEVGNEETRALARRVKVTADERMSLRRYDYPSAAVTIRLKNGSTLETSVVSQHGDFSNPVPREDLLNKFRVLAGSTWDAERIERIIATVDRLDTLGSISELTGLLTAQ